jgi:pre-mRNA-splicing factor ISY1
VFVFSPLKQKYDRVGDEQDAVTDRSKYRYFGAARNLPEVKELYQKKSQPASKRSKYDYKTPGINAKYFGYDDESDPQLLILEQEAEEQGFSPQSIIHSFLKKKV